MKKKDDTIPSFHALSSRESTEIQHTQHKEKHAEIKTLMA